MIECLDFILSNIHIYSQIGSWRCWTLKKLRWMRKICCTCTFKKNSNKDTEIALSPPFASHTEISTIPLGQDHFYGSGCGCVWGVVRVFLLVHFNFSAMHENTSGCLKKKLKFFYNFGNCWWDSWNGLSGWTFEHPWSRWLLVKLAMWWNDFGLSEWAHLVM